MSAWLVGGASAAAVTWATTPVAARLAQRWGVLDRPGPLKPQDAAVPYLGGLAVAIGLVVGVLIDGSAALLVPALAALALGLLDDVRPLRVAARLPVELFIGLGAGWVAGVRHPAALVLAALLVAVVLNAMNFVDGTDGLATAVTGTAAVGCAVLLDAHWAVAAAALVGACLGFLVHNRPPARIYLGDAGAYLLGTALATLLVRTVHEHGLPAAAVGVAALCVYPLAELVSTVVRRLASGRSPFAGDRGHVYDRLHDRGWSKAGTLGALTLTQVCGVAVGLLVLGQLA
jgi:UDP-N-acetylmuramyl pentapeptide phosphotransferase/UDP-N-acetylglucosamine-1-phosphate transferase